MQEETILGDGRDILSGGVQGFRLAGQLVLLRAPVALAESGLLVSRLDATENQQFYLITFAKLQRFSITI